MNNFKFYVQELKRTFMRSNNHVTIDENLGRDNEEREYRVPKKASDVKKKREKRRPRVVSISRTSPAYDYFMTEFRGDKLSCDDYGNVLVPESDYYTSSKTR